MPVLRAVLFDAAGTLIHVRAPVGVTYARLARAHGVTASAERICGVLGRVKAEPARPSGLDTPCALPPTLSCRCRDSKTAFAAEER